MDIFEFDAAFAGELEEEEKGGGRVGGGFGLLVEGRIFQHIEAEGGTGDEDVRPGGEALKEGKGMEGKGVMTGGGGKFDHADKNLGKGKNELGELLLLLLGRGGRGRGREGGVGR